MRDTKITVYDVKEIRTRTTTYMGTGAIRKIDDIIGMLKGMGIGSVLCVMGGCLAFEKGEMRGGGTAPPGPNQAEKPRFFRETTGRMV